MSNSLSSCDWYCLSSAMVTVLTPMSSSISRRILLKFQPNIAHDMLLSPSISCIWIVDLGASNNITLWLDFIASWFWYNPYSTWPVGNLYSSFNVFNGWYFNPLSTNCRLVFLAWIPTKSPFISNTGKVICSFLAYHPILNFAIACFDIPLSIHDTWANGLNRSSTFLSYTTSSCLPCS